MQWLRKTRGYFGFGGIASVSLMAFWPWMAFPALACAVGLLLAIAPAPRGKTER